MAVLTGAELGEMRRRAARAGVLPSWTKAQVNAALQAIEDRMTGTANVGNRSIKTAIGADIEAAAAGVFNAAQKDDLFLLWSQLNARRGGII
jgi:hypothetical protein